MSESKKFVLFVGDEHLKEFMFDFSVSIPSVNAELLRKSSEVVFYSLQNNFGWYSVVAIIKEILLDPNGDGFIIRASQARKLITPQGEDKKEQATKYFEICRKYDSFLQSYQSRGRVAEFDLGTSLFDTGEVLVSNNSKFQGGLTLDKATDLLAETYHVARKQVSIRILNQ